MTWNFLNKTGKRQYYCYEWDMRTDKYALISRAAALTNGAAVVWLGLVTTSFPML